MDFFFEEEFYLITYEAHPLHLNSFINGERVFGVRKKDHRKEYLDFQGEISGNRGIVKIIWTGQYKFISSDSSYNSSNSEFNFQWEEREDFFIKDQFILVSHSKSK